MNDMSWNIEKTVRDIGFRRDVVHITVHVYDVPESNIEMLEKYLKQLKHDTKFVSAQTSQSPYPGCFGSWESCGKHRECTHSTDCYHREEMIDGRKRESV
jgi:hypothetical protein